MPQPTESPLDKYFDMFDTMIGNTKRSGDEPPTWFIGGDGTWHLESVPCNFSGVRMANVLEAGKVVRCCSTCMMEVGK